MRCNYIVVGTTVDNIRDSASRAEKLLTRSTYEQSRRYVSGYVRILRLLFMLPGDKVLGEPSIGQLLTGTTHWRRKRFSTRTNRITPGD